MGWKNLIKSVLHGVFKCRNPLSLDMGWKTEKPSFLRPSSKRSQSAFAGYGLEALNVLVMSTFRNCRNPLSLDMGWKPLVQVEGVNATGSQSAFAGYGLEGLTTYVNVRKNGKVAIRFRWIWVGRDEGLICKLVR